MKSLKTHLFNKPLFFIEPASKSLLKKKNLAMGGLTPRSGTRILCQIMCLNYWYGKSGHRNYKPEEVKSLKNSVQEGSNSSLAFNKTVI